MNKNKKLFAGLAALAVLVLVFGGIYLSSRPDTTSEDKTITVEVVHKDTSAKTFTIATDAEYLSQALLAEGLIQGEEGPYGLYITEADGEAAIYEVDGSYWALYEGDDYATTGVDQTPIEDGDRFSLVYTIG